MLILAFLLFPFERDETWLVGSERRVLSIIPPQSSFSSLGRTSGTVS